VVASYNLGIQVLSFAIISFIVYIDSKDLDKSCWFSHTFFEIAVYSWISLLQLGQPSSWPPTMVRPLTSL
jgi:hypothetical protein